MERRLANFREVTGIDPVTISRFADDLEEPPRLPDRPSPHWHDGPRDHTVLPDIIASTYSDYREESDYAMKQMLAILETLHPIDEYLELFDKSLHAIERRLPFKLIVDAAGKPDWKAIRQRLTSELMTSTTTEEDVEGLSSPQLSAVFDALPFLYDTAACYEQLHQYQNMLAMLVMIAMTGNSLIRRQCISAITVLMERNLLSQEFMKDGVVPGLFFIYQSGVASFQSNDLRMECVQALCQVISYDTIRDRRWLFEHFLPRFSQMLKDPTMHVRKSALQIFGNLGTMFGEKFTEIFLVPHLITLSCDMTWAVRKVACEIFVKVAQCASSAVRIDILSPNFVRLLNDPNKWVAFIAYQQLGPFISLFADPEVTGLELRDGLIIVREINEPKSEEERAPEPPSNGKPFEFVDLPENTWLPEIDYNDDFEFKLALNDPPPRPTIETVKTPRRGERVMDSVISGINKMFSPFERSSPKSNPGKEIEKISATFSSPSKRSPLSLHSAVTLMDKWSKRSNPNNPQRFPIFDSEKSTEKPQKVEEEVGIAAKCNSTDDLTKLGLDDDEDAPPPPPRAAPEDDDDEDSTRTASPRGRRIAKNAWSKLDVRQKLFLRRLGALPPPGSRRCSPKALSPSPTRKGKKQPRTRFEFAAPAEIRGLATSPRRRKVHQSPEHHDENSDEEESNLDQSFALPEEDEDTPLSIEIKSSVSETESVSSSSRSREEPSEFSSLTYWSSNYAISSIDDELKPFGSATSLTNSPTSNNYLESRFDVMKASTSPRARSSSFAVNGSPLAVSPRRKANSTSEAPSPPTATSSTTTSSDSSDSAPMLNTEEREQLGILDMDDLNMSLSSNSSIHGEPPLTEDSDVSMLSLDHPVFPHVPQDLVESYMKVMGPIHTGSNSVAAFDSSLCSEIYRHCAYNFPAVCYTLGRTAWPRLRIIFRKLALDEQARVRQSISFSIHEIAHMLGTEITDEDLLPVFYDLRNDQNAEVRSGILLHLYDFVKCLSPEKRGEMIFSLPQFFPIGAQPGNQAQNGDWRSRFELISQLSKLCSLYSIQDVNLHMSGIALTLADDRVAEVRREAVVLVSTIVGALVAAEWENIQTTRDIENGHLEVKSKKEKTFLSEQFVDDIVSSFAKTQKWTRRQTFSFICAQILRDKECNGIQFRYFFANPLQQLVHDKVPNVRLASCEALSMWRKTLITARAQEKRGQSPLSSPASEPSSIRRDINLVSDLMVRLSNDADIDAAYSAKKCQGLTDEQQPVDVESRTMRMREREELFFGDVILTDEAGSLIRVAGKEVKQIIKRGATVTESPEKEAPIQKMEEFEDESLGASDCSREPVEQITVPPEVVVQMLTAGSADNQDDTEPVDMEIDEEESEDVPQIQKSEEVPMDPTPSAEETSEA